MAEKKKKKKFDFTSGLDKLFAGTDLGISDPTEDELETANKIDTPPVPMRPETEVKPLIEDETKLYKGPFDSSKKVNEPLPGQSPTRSRLNEINDAMQKLQGELAGMKQSDAAVFQEELKKAKDEYKAERERLSTADAVAGFAKSIAKTAAALYGLKAGIDLSQVKMEVPDFKEKRENALKDYVTELDRLKTQHSGRDKQFSSKVDQKMQEASVLKSRANVLRDMEDNELRQRLAEMKSQIKESSGSDKETAAKEKAFQAASTHIIRAKNYAEKDQDENAAKEVQMAENILRTIDPAQFKDSLSTMTKPWWGDPKRVPLEPEEAESVLDTARTKFELGQAKAAPSETPSRQPGKEVPGTKKRIKGKLYVVAADGDTLIPIK